MGIRPESSLSWDKRDGLVLTLLVLAAVLIRLPHLLSPYLINNDAIRYVERAHVIAQSGLWHGFSRGHPSLYPLLIALVHPLVGDWELAARLLSVIFGVLTVIPLFFMARELLGRAKSWIPCFFYCVSSSIVFTSLDIVRDPQFWFFFALWGWALVRALRDEKGVFYVTAGIAALMSATARVDGLILLPVGAAFLLWRGIRGKVVRRNLLGMAYLLLPAVLVALMMLMTLSGAQTRILSKDIRAHLGKVQGSLFESNSARKEVEAAISEAQPPRARRFFAMAWDERRAVLLWKLLDEWVAAVHPLLFALMLLGLFQRSLWREPRWILLACLMAMWLVLGYVYLATVFAFNKRYLIPAAMPGYFFAAGGFSCAVEALRRRWPKTRAPVLTGILVLLVLAIILPKDLKVGRQKKMVRKEAGEWIRGLGIAHPMILSNRVQPAFYAGGRWVSMRRLSSNPAELADLFVWVAGKDGAAPLKILEALRASGRIPTLLRELRTEDEFVWIYRLEKTEPEEGN